MSKKTHYHVSQTYMTEVLGLTEPCPRRNCDGILTEVWVRYKPNTPPIKEKECCNCSKVWRDRPPKPKSPRRYIQDKLPSRDNSSDRKDNKR